MCNVTHFLFVIRQDENAFWEDVQCHSLAVGHGTRCNEGA